MNEISKKGNVDYANITIIILLLVSIGAGYILAGVSSSNYDQPKRNIDETNADGKKNPSVFNEPKKLAGEMIKDPEISIEEAVETCKQKSGEGNCLYWLAFKTGQNSVPDSDAAIEKCMKIGKEHMGACFDGFGNKLATYFENSSQASEVCKEVDGKYRKSCWDGLSGGLGGRFFQNATRNVEECGNLKKEVRHRCYDGMGHGLAANFYPDIDRMKSGCMKVPEERIYQFTNRGWCFKGLGFTMGLHYQDNFKKNIEICKEFGNYTDACFMGLGDSTGEFYSYRSIEEGGRKCKQFQSEKYVNNCIEEIGFGIGRNHIENINKSIELCRENMDNDEFIQCIIGLNKAANRKYEGSKYREKCQKLRGLSKELNNKFSC